MSDVLLIVFVVVCVAAVALILLDLGLRLILGNESDEEEELHGNPMSRMTAANKRRKGGDMPTEMPGVRRQTKQDE